MNKSACKNALTTIITLIAVPVILTSISVAVSSCDNTKNHDSADDISEYVRGHLEGDTSSYVKPSLSRLDSVSKIGQRETDKELLHLANNMMLTGSHLKAIALLEGRRNMLESLKNRDRNSTDALLSIYVCLGAAYEETGMPGMGLDCYSRGLELAGDTACLRYRAMLLNNIGVLYSKSLCYDEAEVYFKKALDINLKRNIRGEAALNYMNLSEIFNIRKQYRKAIDASLKGLQYFDSEKYPENFYYTHLFLGLLYARTGEFDISLSYLRNGLSRLNELHSVPGTIEAYDRLGETFKLMGKTDSTLFYLKKAVELARDANLHPSEKISLVNLGNTYKEQGNYEQAAKCFEMSVQLADSLHNEESKLRLKEWSTRCRQPAGGRQPGSDSFSSSEIIICCVMSVMIVALIITLFVYRIKFNRRQKAAQSVICNLNREKDQAHVEIDRLNREHTAGALDRMKMHEGLDNICDDIRAIINDSGIKSASLLSRHRELLEKLNQLSTSLPEDFKRYFEQVHPDVYKSLEERCPTLTQKDLRLCGFIVLGLSTKEISALTFREVRSVESARNRLKKKLGLDVDTDLSEYLRSLTRR